MISSKYENCKAKNWNNSTFYYNKKCQWLMNDQKKNTTEKCN